MDQIERLNQRRAELERAGARIRAQIKEIFDADSFVELTALGFSEEFCRGGQEGEGVVTGYATVDGYPFYVAAQDFGRDFGALTKANCEKIARLLERAEKYETPVVWLLHSQGVKPEEGVDVLEGISRLLLQATRLKGTVPQYAVIGGEVYGAAAEIAAIADVVFFLKEGVLATSSPFVLSAKGGKNLKKEEVGGIGALRHSLLPAIEVKSLDEVGAYLKQFTELLGLPVIDAELNTPAPALNRGADVKAVLSLVEDGIELGGTSCPEVRTVLGRIGGIAAAVIAFDRVKLNAENIRKIGIFTEFACRYGLPLVLFTDCEGIEQSLSANDSPVLKEIAAYLEALDATDTKIAAVTGKAVGLGYSLFAAKSAGFDYTLALATAEIAPFGSAAGAEIVYGTGERSRYREEFSDPFHAAKGGYLDDIVEPQFLKQYLISALQMLAR